MSMIKMAYALHYFPDYDGDRHPWHWYSGETVDDLTRATAHATEVEAFEYLGHRLLTMARQRRELTIQRGE
jgi:hypothetical protein